MANQTDKKSIVIDPAGCGCTDCIVRRSTPEDQISEKQVRQMINGREVFNRTGGPIRFNVEYTDTHIEVKSAANTVSERHWSIDRDKVKKSITIEFI